MKEAQSEGIPADKLNAVTALRMRLVDALNGGASFKAQDGHYQLGMKLLIPLKNFHGSAQTWIAHHKALYSSIRNQQ